jgi:hypothetical protein
MTSTTPRIITIAFATLALAAPVASGMPIRDGGDVGTSSLAGTISAPQQDLRNADQQAPAPATPPNVTPTQVLPPQQPQTMKPVVITKTQPVPADDNGVSPFVYIIPSLVLIAMLAAGFGYARLSRRPASA